MKNSSLFIVGIIMLVFAGMFHLYRHGRTMAKAPPPKIVTSPTGAKPIPTTTTAKPTVTSRPSGGAEKPLAPPPVQQSTKSQASDIQSSSSKQSGPQSSVADNTTAAISQQPAPKQNEGAEEPNIKSASKAPESPHSNPKPK